MLRIGMLTSGGDCQALNAAMRGVFKAPADARSRPSATPMRTVWTRSRR